MTSTSSTQAKPAAGVDAEHAADKTGSPALIAAIARHRVLAVIAVLAILPFLVPYQSLTVNMLIYGLFAMGFNLLYGYTGMLSFGHAAFFGSGAYACGIAIARYGLPWWAGIAIGTGLGGAIAVVMGLLAIRSRGIYFSMVTLALAQCVYFIFFQASGITGGDNGLRGVNVKAVDLFGMKLSLLDPMAKYYFILAFVALALWLLSRILASPFGAAIEAIRENESRALACGFDVPKTKFLAFVLSALFCSLAGTLNAIHLSTVAIDVLSYHTSGQVLMTTLLGGMGTFFGPFAGAIAFLAIEHVVTGFVKYWQLVVGAIFIGLVLFFPKGIWGTLLGRIAK